MTREEYRASKRVNNSILDYILPERGGSVKKYAAYASNPEMFPKIEGDAVDIGNLMHLYIQNPSAFSIMEADFPGDKVKHVIDRLYGDGTGKLESLAVRHAEILKYADEVDLGGSKWTDSQIIENVEKNGAIYYRTLIDNPGVIFADSPIYNKVQSMIHSLSDCMIIHDYEMLYGKGCHSLEEHPIEFTMFGVECKSLLDKLIFADKGKRAINVDYKTISTSISKYIGYTPVGGGFTIPGIYIERHVHRQFAFYAQAIKAEYPDVERIDSVLLIQENTYPYEWSLFLVPDEVISDGLEILNWAFHTIRHNVPSESI